MRISRLLCTAAVTLFAASTAFAAPCATAPEQHAFDVIALKSFLMVGALSCGQGEQYDNFMTRFQPYILAQQHVIDHYFEQAGGQASEDDYVTQLANNQSEASLNTGAAFCGSFGAVFVQVLSLASPDALDGFLTANKPAQPIAFDTCPDEDTPAATTAAAAPATSPPQTAAQHDQAAQAEQELTHNPADPATPVVAEQLPGSHPIIHHHTETARASGKKPAGRHEPGPIVSTTSV
jgi:hypothetical protein